MADTPSSGALRLDRFLTNAAISYAADQTRFFADKIFPLIGVEDQGGQFLTMPRGALLRDEMRHRPLGDQPERASGWEPSKTPYFCEEWALQDRIDDRQKKNNRSSWDLKEAATTGLTLKHLIRRDRIWVNRFWKPGVWGATFTGVASAPGANQFLQLDQAASDVLTFIRQRRRAFHARTGYVPNVLTLGANVLDTLLENPDIKEAIKYTQRAVLNTDLLASFFEVERIVVLDSAYNAAKEGQADDVRYIADPKSMALFHVTDRPAPNMPSAGYILVWNELYDADVDETFGGIIKEGRDWLAESDIVAIYSAYDQVVAAPDLGEFYQNVVA
jgi:hypothetical protein